MKQSLPLHTPIGLVIVLIFLLPATSRAEAPSPLSSYNWAVNASPNLAINPPPEEVVRKFMEDKDSGETGVCSYRFADLRHAKNLSLLVVLNGNGFHGGCGELDIIDRTAAGFEEHSGKFNIFGDDDLHAVARDINGDGKLELIFDSEFTDYRGASHFCYATWPVIYAWDGSNYANVSAQPQFKQFYEQEINAQQQEVAKAKRILSTYKHGNHPWDGDGDPCAMATIAKIQRFLGAPPDTGKADAIRWANSSDPWESGFGADVLSDINGKKPREEEFLDRDDFSPQD